MWPRTILVKLALATARLRQPPEAEVEAKYKTSYNDRGGKGGCRSRNMDFCQTGGVVLGWIHLTIPS